MYHSGGGHWFRGGYAYIRAVGIWETSVPSSQFCHEAETVLKNSLN